jgi:hypothetical protein
MDQGQLVIGLVSLIIMVIPAGTLFWKFSRIVFQVEDNRKDINALAEKLNRRLDRIDERFIGNEAKLVNIEVTMGRLEEKMNILLAERKGQKTTV